MGSLSYIYVNTPTIKIMFCTKINIILDKYYKIKTLLREKLTLHSFSEFWSVCQQRKNVPMILLSVTMLLAIKFNTIP